MTWLWQLLFLLLPLGAPALIGFLAPRRWRLWALALWIMAPLLVVLAVGGSEVASGKASPADLDKLVFGVLLIGSFVAVPWLIACGLGYAAGAFVRRQLRPEPAAASRGPAPVPVLAPQPISAVRGSTPPPPDPVAAEWLAGSARRLRSRRSGARRTPRLVFAVAARGCGARDARPSVAPGPAAPLHDLRHRRRHAGDPLRRGGAVERCLGFLPLAGPGRCGVRHERRREPALEHDLGPFENGRYEAAAPVARLSNARTGAPLFDGSAWLSSRVVPQADGSPLLALEHRQQQPASRWRAALLTIGA